MKWKTKEGKVMDVKEMDDNHLINSIRLVKRSVAKYRDAAVSSALDMAGMVSGDMASDMADRAFDRAVDLTDQEILKSMGYFGLLYEARKRKLNV